MKKVILLAFTVFLCSTLFAEKIIFSADSMSGQASNSSTYTLLDGHAYIKTETMEISADKIELTGEDYRIIKAAGNVDGTNIESKMEFKCETLEYDRETEVAILQGSVKLVDKENEVNANAQVIEYNQSTNIAVLQIDVSLTQKKNVCKGVYAVYQKDKQLLEISGNAEVRQDGDTFRAQQITLNLDTQDITLSGNVKGSVTSTSKEEEKESPKESPVESPKDLPKEMPGINNTDKPEDMKKN